MDSSSVSIMQSNEIKYSIGSPSERLSRMESFSNKKHILFHNETVFREQCTHCANKVALFRCAKHNTLVNYLHTMVRASAYQFGGSSVAISIDYVDHLKCSISSDCDTAYCGWCRDTVRQRQAIHSWQLVKCPRRELEPWLQVQKRNLRNIVRSHRNQLGRELNIDPNKLPGKKNKCKNKRRFSELVDEQQSNGNEAVAGPSGYRGGSSSSSSASSTTDTERETASYSVTSTSNENGGFIHKLKKVKVEPANKD